MKPITFACKITLTLPPEEIAGQILDLSKWPEFTGYGPLPGIKRAEFETQTPDVVGTRIRVTNGDGSSHVEEITEWNPTRRLQLRMNGFTPPLSRLATEFVETWEFETEDTGTHITRSFALHAKSIWTKPFLWLIARLLKRAINRHLKQMRQAAFG